MWWRKKASPPMRQVIRCSFCRKHQDDVTRLIAGPEVFICDECVEVCNDVIADDQRFEQRSSGKPAARRDDNPLPWPHAIACVLCRKAIDANEGTVIGGHRGTLCADCVTAVRHACASGQ